MTSEESKVLDSLKRVTIELKGAREQLRQAEERPREPIAIVGMGCRYPGGVSSPDDLWELVAAGGDGISCFPDDRGWELDDLPQADPGEGAIGSTPEGGFLDDAFGFDASFFGINPAEAPIIDPQHRQLLEATWESCENAGIDPADLRGTRAGVFAGVMYQDYGIDIVETPDLGGLVPPRGAGACFVSGRLSYALGFEGPAVSVDTACSSSLVAIHLAMQALRAGDCSLAVAGGVTVLSSPFPFESASAVGGLAGDRRCKAFAAAADGTSLSEGVGVLLLERLSDAERNGHRPIALLRGSAVNQDGTSNGITAPNGPAQEQVIRQALAEAGLGPGEIDAVEAHGTGTTLGDPIEAQAILATYGQGRERPLALGSIKSNIGHTQAAAGVAGVIKMALAMRHQELPRTLYAEEPTPHVDWSSGKVELLRDSCAWEANGHPRRAGVSSFGASGTNAHVILEEAPPGDREQAGDTDVATAAARAWISPLLLSARSEEALRERAARLERHLTEHPELPDADVARSLAVGSPHLERRAVVSAGDREQLIAGLAALATGEDADQVAAAVPRVANAEPVFVFPGQGGQWKSMAIELLGSSPIFAAAIDDCEQALEPHLEWSLESVLRRQEGAPGLERIDVVQPVLFAVSVALAALWRSCGVEPGAVLGHSQGEIAAAYVAGGLSLDDAAQLIARRSQVLVQGTGNGSMAVVASGPDDLSARVPAWEEWVSLAGINGPSMIVISGPDDGIDEVLGRCEEAGIWTHRILAAVGAGHSPVIEQGRELLLEAAAGISPKPSSVPFYSSVVAGPLDTAELDPEYWYRNARQTVRFGPAVSLLLGEGFRNFVEVSPNPIFGFSLHEAFSSELGDAAEGAFTGTLERHKGSLHDFGLAVGKVWAAGAEVDWDAAMPPAPTERVPLPTYPFQRERFWLQPAPRDRAGTGDGAAPGSTVAQPADPGGGTLVERLAFLSEEARREETLAFVCDLLGQLLGRSGAEVDPSKPFLELGFDSITALQYRNRINHAIGFSLDLRVVLDYPTPEALVDHLMERIDVDGPAGPVESGGSLAPLLLNARERGQTSEFVELIDKLASFRTSFATPEEVGIEPFAVRLAEASRRPRLVCVPSLVPTGGPHEYAKLAKGFDGEQDVTALRWPGFVDGEPLPAGAEAAIELQVAAIERAAGAAPIVLLGHSTGGAFAYAITQRLQGLGRPAAGLVMIDSYHPAQTAIEDGEVGAAIGVEILGRLLDAGGADSPVSDASLTAATSYIRQLGGLDLGPIEAPILLVRCSEPVGGRAEEAEWRPRWDLPHELAEVPGDHLTMMDAHARATAKTIARWLETAIGELQETQANQEKEVQT